MNVPSEVLTDGDTNSNVIVEKLMAKETECELKGGEQHAKVRIPGHTGRIGPLPLRMPSANPQLR